MHPRSRNCGRRSGERGDRRRVSGNVQGASTDQAPPQSPSSFGDRERLPRACVDCRDGHLSNFISSPQDFARYVKRGAFHARTHHHRNPECARLTRPSAYGLAPNQLRSTDESGMTYNSGVALRVLDQPCRCPTHPVALGTNSSHHSRPTTGRPDLPRTD